MKDAKKKRLIKIGVFVLLTAIVLAYFVHDRTKGADEVLTYDQIITYVKDDKIDQIEVNKKTNKASIEMKDGSKKEGMIPSLDVFTFFISEEIQNGSEIKFKIVRQKTSILALAVLCLIQFKKYYQEKQEKVANSKIKFSDVAGIEEEKEQLQEIVDFLKNPKKYTEMGAKIPKGILLTGDPGTGKTLLAKAIAGEAGVPFYQTTGSSFEEIFTGVGAARIRELFKKAKKEPSIIFIDEIDSIAKSRYRTVASNNEQTLGQLLAEMDGFKSDDSVIVIAATNHPEVLDSAILRPGRFDRKIFIPKPDVRAREQILKVHAKNKKLAEDVSFKEIAKKTIGFSGADLENVLNEAAIYAVKQNETCICKKHIDEAFITVLVGLEKKNAVISEKDKKITAVHEAGHAIVSLVLRPEVKIFGISIIPRGSAGGYNMFDKVDARYQMKNDIIKSLQVDFAGRAAEELIFDDFSTGASNDLENASKKAHDMLTKFAMKGSFIVKITGQEEYNKQIDIINMKNAESICIQAYNDAKNIIFGNWTVFDKLVELLLEKEYLSAEEIETFKKENL